MRPKEIFRLTFHEGFTSRLLSGDLSIDEDGNLSYSVRAFPDICESGEVFSEDLFEKIFNVVTSGELDLIKGNYESGWDDVGASTIRINSNNKSYSISICGGYDPDKLKNKIEHKLFELNKELLDFANEIYETRKN